MVGHDEKEHAQCELCAYTPRIARARYVRISYLARIRKLQEICSRHMLQHM